MQTLKNTKALTLGTRVKIIKHSWIKPTEGEIIGVFSQGQGFITYNVYPDVWRVLDKAKGIKGSLLIGHSDLQVIDHEKEANQKRQTA